MKQMFYPFRSLLFLAAGLIATVKTQAQCNPVSSITSSSWRCDSASISWPLVSGATNYIYAVNQTRTSPSAGILNTTGSALVGNLVPSTLYYVHVRTNCSATIATWAKDSFTTPACAPGICLAPATISYSNITNNTATVTWGTFASAIGYEYAVNQTFASPTGSGTAVTVNSANLTGLTSGSTYYFHVRSKCSATSFSDWKNGTLFQTTGSDPNCAAPSLLSAAALGCDSISITWPAISTASSYGYAVTQSATPSVILTGNTNSFTWRNLTPSTLYYVHVRTNCSLSKSAYRTDTFRTTACGATACLAPASVTYNSITPNAATVSWTAASGATGYEYVINQSTANPTANGTATSNMTVSLSGLAAGTTYYWHIRTRCGTNSFSAWKPAATLITPRGTGISNTTPGSEIFSSVYPNPANQSITVDLNVVPGKNAQLTILSIEGRNIKTVVPNSKTTIDISDLQNGIYFIRYSDAAQNQVLRFTKQ